MIEIVLNRANERTWWKINGNLKRNRRGCNARPVHSGRKVNPFASERGLLAGEGRGGKGGKWNLTEAFSPISSVFDARTGPRFLAFYLPFHSEKNSRRFEEQPIVNGQRRGR